MKFKLSGSEVSLLCAVLGGHAPSVVWENGRNAALNREMVRRELALFCKNHPEWASCDSNLHLSFEPGFEAVVLRCLKPEIEISIDNNDAVYLCGRANQYIRVERLGTENACSYLFEDGSADDLGREAFFRFLGLRYQESRFPAPYFRWELTKEPFERLTRWHAKGKFKKIEKYCLAQGKNYEVCMRILEDTGKTDCLVIHSSKVRNLDYIMLTAHFDQTGTIRFKKFIGTPNRKIFILGQDEAKFLPDTMSDFGEHSPLAPTRSKSGIRKGMVLFWGVMSLLILIGIVHFIAGQDRVESSPDTVFEAQAADLTTDDILLIERQLDALNEKIPYPNGLENFTLFMSSQTHTQGSALKDLEIGYVFDHLSNTQKRIYYDCTNNMYLSASGRFETIELSDGTKALIDNEDQLSFVKDDFKCTVRPANATRSEIIAFAKALAFVNAPHPIVMNIDIRDVALFRLPGDFTADPITSVTFLNWRYGADDEMSSELEIHVSDAYSANASLTYSVLDRPPFGEAFYQSFEKKSIHGLDVYISDQKDLYFQKDRLFYHVYNTPKLNLTDIVRRGLASP